MIVKNYRFLRQAAAGVEEARGGEKKGEKEEGEGEKEGEVRKAEQEEAVAAVAAKQNPVPLLAFSPGKDSSKWEGSVKARHARK